MKTKRCPWKNLGKLLNVPFFGGIFQFCVYFFGIQRFLYFWSKILCVKLEIFAWKISILCAWKIKANAWIFVKKSTWKTPSVREISSKSLREKRLTYVKKMKKRPKNRFTHTIFFHVEKKNTATNGTTRKVF